MNLYPYHHVFLFPKIIFTGPKHRQGIHVSLISFPVSRFSFRLSFPVVFQEFPSLEPSESSFQPGFTSENTLEDEPFSKGGCYCQPSRKGDQITPSRSQERSEKPERNEKSSQKSRSKKTEDVKGGTFGQGSLRQVLFEASLRVLDFRDP